MTGPTSIPAGYGRQRVHRLDAAELGHDGVRLVALVPHQGQGPTGDEHPGDLPQGHRGSNQWKAWATTTASMVAPPSGTASAVPPTTSTPGTVRRKTSRMAADGSTATTVAPVTAKARASFPVPAARSSTVRPGASPASSMIRPTAAAG